MYQVIKTIKQQDGTSFVEVISTHKKEEHAVNRCNRVAGAGFSVCWGTTYSVKLAQGN